MKRVMMGTIGAALALSLAHGEVVRAPEVSGGIKPIVVMQTSLGEIELRLEPQKAPVSVYNFLDYANSGFYDGTVLHRVVRGFVVQGGAFTPGLKEKPGKAPIRNEAANGLRNRRGTIAVARPIEIDSATSQFFINVVDNRSLDHRDDTIQGFGYAVFGKVIRGMEVVDRIQAVPTVSQKGMRWVPAEPVIVHSVRLVYPKPVEPR